MNGFCSKFDHVPTTRYNYELIHHPQIHLFHTETMNQNSPSQALKNRRSIVIAFHKLLKALRQDSEVLLLDMRDSSANQAVQEYNDVLSDKKVDPLYRNYVDLLAETFNNNDVAGKTSPPLMPNQQQILVADRLLSRILEGQF